MFIQDLPKCVCAGSRFLTDLLKLLEAMGIKRDLVSEKELLEYDWSNIRVKLVCSIPGMHYGRPSYGLRMLENAVPVIDKELTFECLGSSLGALDSDWLNEFIQCAQPSHKAISISDPGKRVKIVFPTMEHVMNSTSGPGAFGTQFHDLKKWRSSKYPRDSHVCCESIFGAGQPLHAKIISATVKGNEKWWYIGSHNFTKSAWGRIVKSGSAILIANYELGIIFTKEDGQILFPEGFPYPYKRPAKPYNDKDLPWIQSLVFGE